jgi:hypothetical protein
VKVGRGSQANLWHHALEDGKTWQENLGRQQPRNRTFEERRRFLGPYPAKRIQKAVETKCNPEIRKRAIPIALTDAATMTPPAGARSIERHEIVRVGDRQLIRGKANSRRGCLGGFLKKGTQQPDRAELNSDTKPIVVAPVFGNKGAIGIVKMEMSSELIGCRLAREAPIPALLVFCQEIYRHLLRPALWTP